MRTRRFLEQLRRELPVWIERGWVNPGADRAILDHVAAQAVGTRYLTYALSVLGVLLLGTGIITYFAANWGLIPKAVKLLILFGAMWLAYGAAWHALRDERAPHLGQALLLLGVILFGSNIMLIAQVYHIDAHFPNGVLMWSLGALAGAYLLRSQPALVAAIALGTLWTGLETDWFDREVHWAFLLLWAAFLPLVYRTQWRASLHVTLIALLAWSWFSVEPLLFHWGNANRLYVVQVYFLGYLTLFLLGRVMATYVRLMPFSGPVERYGAFAALVAAYALTYPRLHTDAHWRWGATDPSRVAAGDAWIALTIAVLVVVVAAALWHRRRTAGAARPAYLVWGQLLVGVIVALVIANLFLTGKHGGLVAIGFNLLYFAGLVWLVYAGMHQDDRFLVNLAFVFFAVVLLSRYFDTFWTLLNRSYFFMIGGLILIVGGYFLEQQRRRITSGIAARRGGEGAP